jgi:hypothetical protein
MQEVSDPPETVRKAETKNITSIGKDVIFEQDPCSSYQLCMCSGSFQVNQILLVRFCWVCVYLPPIFLFHSVGGSMKFEEDGHLLSQAKRDLSHLVQAFS